MVPTSQDPTDLSLVVAGDGDLGALTVLRQATVSWQDLEVTFHVLCESHEVILRRDGRVVLHELLSCAGGMGPARPVHLHRFRDGRGHSYREDGYSVDVSFEVLPARGIAPPASGLCSVFPRMAGDEATPFTSIRWEQSDAHLVWHTVHLYPLPGRTVGVFSTSSVTHSAGVARNLEATLVAH